MMVADFVCSGLFFKEVAAKTEYLKLALYDVTTSIFLPG